MSQSQKRVYHGIRIAVWVTVIIIAVHVFQFILDGRLAVYGIYPRNPIGLRGILFAPFIHGDIQHVISNIVPMFVLTWLVFAFYSRVAWPVYLLLYLLTGLAVWLFAREVLHIGASGVVYALVAFVFWSGVFRKNFRSIVLALIVLFLYSGYFLGILPNQEGISWESHLFGGIVGIIVAFIFKGRIEAEEKGYIPSWEREGYQEENEEFFLDRDVFNKRRRF